MEKGAEDLSGRDRLVWNTVVSWASHFALVVSGFIMPRMIDHFIGQVSLGIWDFCWSFVNYINLVGLGVGASVSRYSAKHRAEGEIHKLQALVSSVALIQAFMAIAAILITVTIVIVLPKFYSGALHGELETAQKAIGILGMVIAVQLFFDSCRGVITGHHRWDIHNGLHAGGSISALILMTVSLVAGFDIVGLAIGYSIAMIGTELVRVYVASRVAPDVKFSYRHATKENSKQALTFGIKNIFIHLPPVILTQSVSLVLVRELGPALLAVYSRPLALVRHILTFMNKYTHMLMPTAGAMEKNQLDELKEFYVATTKYSLSFTLPALATLFIYGDLVLYVWMGEGYANATLMAILALGYLLPISQDVSMRMVIGTNNHGMIAIINFVVVVALFGILYLFFSRSGWDLESFALLLTVPLTVVYGILMPLYACKKLKVSVMTYISKGLVLPTLAATPFIGLLAVSRFSFGNQMYLGAAVLAVLSVVVLAIVYFRMLLETEQKNRLLNKLPASLRARLDS